MARHRIASALFAAVFALLLAPVFASGDAQNTQLISVGSTVAGDTSILLKLDFNGPAPEARIIRSNDHLVHVVFVGATIARDARFDTLHLGEINTGIFSGFEGIGVRLDLQTRDRGVAIRASKSGRSVYVHVPALRSDLEAELENRSAAKPIVRVSAPLGLFTAIVKLSYADVSEVAGTLVKGAVVPSTDTFTATSPFSALGTGSGDSGRSSSSETPPPKAPAYVSIQTAGLLPKDTPQGVRFDDHVAVDRRLNAVILTGTPAEVDAYKAVVAALDVPTRSVLLETQIVELSTSAAKDIGIDYAAGGTKFATGTFNPTSGGAPKAGLTASAALAALEQTGQAKILARPRILALNNRPAAILSGEAVPIFTSVVTPGGSSTVIQNQIQYINVGVSLQILPRISYDGRVTTQIFCEVSNIIDFVGITPRISVRQELTSSVVNDGESLIVGGLLEESDIRTMKKVPSLGNLPLIGQFFRDQTTTSQSTNLYIVVTPHILTNGVNGTTEETPAAPVSLPTIPPDGAQPGSMPEPLTPSRK